MATWEDVRRIALALPETVETVSRQGGGASWVIRAGARTPQFAWERPLRKSDVTALDELGAEVPEGPILAVRTADLGVKEALLNADPQIYFSTPHFDAYPAVLVRLGRIGRAELAELLSDAWLARAPNRLAAAYLSALTKPGGDGD